VCRSAHKNRAWFRGHREGWKDKIRGNFKDLTILLAKYSSPLASHLIEVHLKGKHIYHFTSWQRQIQLIQAIATQIRNSIKDELLTRSLLTELCISARIAVTKNQSRLILSTTC
jgi:hypothetical protein